MSDDPERLLSDDELAARLRQAQTPPPAHDPFFDLPMAHQVAVPGDGTSPGDGGRCGAPARRPAAVQGGYGVSADEQVRCELPSGHPGPHRGDFSRSRIRRRWRAYEWSA